MLSRQNSVLVVRAEMVLEQYVHLWQVLLRECHLAHVLIGHGKVEKRDRDVVFGGELTQDRIDGFLRLSLMHTQRSVPYNILWSFQMKSRGQH